MTAMRASSVQGRFALGACFIRPYAPDSPNRIWLPSQGVSRLSALINQIF